jgi:hypothetical protein
MEKYNDFKDSFPDYPFPEEFDEDFKIENYIFLPVYRDGHWGYVNESGREMIKPLYDDASLFSEGLAAVTRNGKTGFINKKGNEIIKLQFNDADPFHNGAAIVIKDSLYGLINKRGEYITPPMYDALTETSGDLYIASNNGSYGYIHKYGKAITPFDYEIAKDFRGGYAVVRKGGLYGLINSTGKFELNPSYKELDFINDTLLKAADTDGMWGIIQVNGDTVVPFMYEAIGDFSENRALVSKGGQCGYIDETGHVIIHLKFNYSPFLLQTASFKNGFALLKQKQKSVLIDSNGKVIKFNGVEDYKLPSFGFVPVQKNKKWGFADFNGKIKIACMYESVEPFDEILTVVKRKNESGLIDTSGVTFIQPLYQEITLIKNAIKVKSDNNWGLLSRRGILYLSCRYSRIDLITPDIVQAKDENGFTYVNLKTGKIIFSASE